MDLDEDNGRGEDVDWDRAMDAILGAIQSTENTQARIDTQKGTLIERLITRELVFSAPGAKFRGEVDENMEGDSDGDGDEDNEQEVLLAGISSASSNPKIVFYGNKESPSDRLEDNDCLQTSNPASNNGMEEQQDRVECDLEYSSLAPPQINAMGSQSNNEEDHVSNIIGPVSPSKWRRRTLKWKQSSEEVRHVRSGWRSYVSGPTQTLTELTPTVPHRPRHPLNKNHPRMASPRRAARLRVPEELREERDETVRRAVPDSPLKRSITKGGNEKKLVNAKPVPTKQARMFSIASPQDSMSSRIANAYSPAFKLLCAHTTRLIKIGPSRKRRKRRISNVSTRGTERKEASKDGSFICAPQRKTFTLPNQERTTRVLYLSDFDLGAGVCGHELCATGFEEKTKHTVTTTKAEFPCLLSDEEWVMDSFAATNGRHSGYTPALLQTFSTIQNIAVEVPCQVVDFDSQKKMYTVRISLFDDGHYASKICPRTILRFHNEPTKCFQERIRQADNLRFVNGMYWKYSQLLDYHPRQSDAYIDPTLLSILRQAAGESSSRFWTFRERIIAGALNFPLHGGLRRDENILKKKDLVRSNTDITASNENSTETAGLPRSSTQTTISLATLLEEMRQLLEIQDGISDNQDTATFQERVQELVDTIFTTLLPSSVIKSVDDTENGSSDKGTPNHDALIHGVASALDKKGVKHALRHVVEKAHEMLGKELFEVTESHMHEAACAYSIFLSSKPAHQLQRRRNKIFHNWHGTPEWARPRMLAMHALPIEEWRLRAVYKLKQQNFMDWQRRTQKPIQELFNFSEARQVVQARALFCFDHLREYMLLAQQNGVDLPSVLAEGELQMDFFLGIKDLAPPMRAESFTKKQSNHLQTVAHLLSSKWLHGIIMLCLGKLQGLPGPDGSTYQFYTRSFEEYYGSCTERLVHRTRLVARQYLFEYMHSSLQRYVTLFECSSGFTTSAKLLSESDGRRLDVYLEKCLSVQSVKEGLFTVQLHFEEGAFFQPTLDEVRQRVLSTVEKLAHILLTITNPTDDLVPVLAALRAVASGKEAVEPPGPLIPLVLQSLMTIHRKRWVGTPVHYMFHRTIQTGDPFQFVVDSIWTAKCRLDAIISESVATADEVMNQMDALESKILEGVHSKVTHIARLDLDMYVQWFTQPWVRRSVRREIPDDTNMITSMFTGDTPGVLHALPGFYANDTASDSDNSSLGWGQSGESPISAESHDSISSSSSSSGFGESQEEEDIFMKQSHDVFGTGTENDFINAAMVNQANPNGDDADLSGKFFSTQDLSFREVDAFPQDQSCLEANYKLSVHLEVEKFMLQACEAEVLRLREAANHINDELPSDVHIPLFKVESRKAKRTLRQRCEDMAMRLMHELHSQAMASLQNAQQEYSELLESIQLRISTADDLSALWKFEMELESILARIWSKWIAPAERRFEVLERLLYMRSHEGVLFQAALLAEPARIIKVCKERVEKAKSQESIFLVQLNAEKERFKDYVQQLRAQIAQVAAKDQVQEATQIAAEAEYVNEAVLSAYSTMETLASRIRVFDRPEKAVRGIPVVKSNSTLDAERVLAEVKQLVERANLYNQLWSIVADSREAIQLWRQGSFVQLDADYVEELILDPNTGWVSNLDRLLDNLNGADDGTALTICLSVKQTLLDFTDELPLLRLLSSKALRARHWRQIVSIMVPLDGAYLGELLGLIRMDADDEQEQGLESCEDDSEKDDDGNCAEDGHSALETEDSPSGQNGSKSLEGENGDSINIPSLHVSTSVSAALNQGKSIEAIQYDKVSLRTLEDLNLVRYYDEIVEICALAEHEYEVEKNMDRMATALHTHRIRTVKTGITAMHVLALSSDHGEHAQARADGRFKVPLTRNFSSKAMLHRDHSRASSKSVSSSGAHGNTRGGAEGEVEDGSIDDIAELRPTKSLDVDNIVRMIEDQLVQMQNIQASKYTRSGDMIGRAEAWTKGITHLRHWLQAIKAFQSKWEPIEALFAESLSDMPGIQLSQKEIRSFHFANKLWDQFTQTVSNRRVSLHLLMDVLQGRKLDVAAKLQLEQEFRVPGLQLVQDLNECIEAINDSLCSKLDVHRAKFPRFYFISDPQLMQFISSGQADFAYLRQNIGLLFDNVSEINFEWGAMEFGRADRMAETILGQHVKHLGASDLSSVQIYQMEVQSIHFHHLTHPMLIFGNIALAHKVTKPSEDFEILRRVPVESWLQQLEENCRALYVSQVKEVSQELGELDSWDQALQAVKDASLFGAVLTALRICCTHLVETKMGDIHKYYDKPALQLINSGSFLKSTILTLPPLEANLEGAIAQLDKGIQFFCKHQLAPEGLSSQVFYLRNAAVINTLQDFRDRALEAIKEPLRWELGFRSYMDERVIETQGFNLRIETLGAHFTHGLAWDAPENPRLVISPVTLQCLRAMALTATNGLVGCLLGPEARGKTATIRELALLTGTRCLVLSSFWLSKVEPFQRILHGLVASNSWGLIEDFDQLSSKHQNVLNSWLRAAHQELLHTTRPGHSLPALFGTMQGKQMLNDTNLWVRVHRVPGPDCGIVAMLQFMSRFQLGANDARRLGRELSVALRLIDCGEHWNISVVNHVIAAAWQAKSRAEAKADSSTKGRRSMLLASALQASASAESLRGFIADALLHVIEGRAQDLETSIGIVAAIFGKDNAATKDAVQVIAGASVPSQRRSRLRRKRTNLVLAQPDVKRPSDRGSLAKGMPAFSDAQIDKFCNVLFSQALTRLGLKAQANGIAPVCLDLLHASGVFSQTDTVQRCGIILVGPPATGKSLVLKVLLQALNIMQESRIRSVRLFTKGMSLEQLQSNQDCSAILNVLCNSGPTSAGHEVWVGFGDERTYTYREQPSFDDGAEGIGTSNSKASSSSATSESGGRSKATQQKSIPNQIFIGGIDNEKLAAHVLKAIKHMSWLILDGPLQNNKAAHLVEHLVETVDRAICTGTTNEGDRIALPGRTSVVFETDTLAGVSPSLLTKCTLIHTDEGTLPFRDILYAWLHGSPEISSNDTGRPALGLQAQFIPHRKRIEEMCHAALPVVWALASPTPDTPFPARLVAKLATTVNSILADFHGKWTKGVPDPAQVLTEEQNVPARQHVEAAVLLGILWTVGQFPTLDMREVDAALRRVLGPKKARPSALSPQVEAAVLFGKDARRSSRVNMKVAIFLPDLEPDQTLFDFGYSVEQSSWVLWEHFMDTAEAALHREDNAYETDLFQAHFSLRVPTSDQRRAAWLLSTQLAYRADILCTGPALSGKRFLVERALAEHKLQMESKFSRATTIQRVGLSQQRLSLLSNLFAKFDRVKERLFAPPTFADDVLYTNAAGEREPLGFIFIDDLALQHVEAEFDREQLRGALSTGALLGAQGEKVRFHGCSFVAVTSSAALEHGNGRRLETQFMTEIRLRDLHADEVVAVYAPAIRRACRSRDVQAPNEEFPWLEVFQAFSAVLQNGVLAADACKYLLKFGLSPNSSMLSVIKTALCAWSYAARERLQISLKDHELLLRKLIEQILPLVQGHYTDANVFAELEENLIDAFCDDEALLDINQAGDDQSLNFALSLSKAKKEYDSDEEDEDTQDLKEGNAYQLPGTGKSKGYGSINQARSSAHSSTVTEPQDSYDNKQEVLVVIRDRDAEHRISTKRLQDFMHDIPVFPTRLMATYMSRLKFCFDLPKSNTSIDPIVLIESSQVPSLRFMLISEVARVNGFELVQAQIPTTVDEWQTSLRDLLLQAGKKNPSGRKRLLYLDASVYYHQQHMLRDVEQLARRGTVEHIIDWSQVQLNEFPGIKNVPHSTESALLAREEIWKSREDSQGEDDNENTQSTKSVAVKHPRRLESMSRGNYRSLVQDEFLIDVCRNLRIVVHASKTHDLKGSLQSARCLTITRPSLEELADLTVQVIRQAVLHSPQEHPQPFELVSLFKRSGMEFGDTSANDSLLEFSQVLLEIHSLATHNQNDILGNVNSMLRLAWSATRRLVRVRTDLQSHYAETEQALLMIDVTSLFAVSMRGELATLEPKLETAKRNYERAREQVEELEEELGFETSKLDAETQSWRAVDARVRELRDTITFAIDEVSPILATSSENLNRLPRARVVELRNLRNPNAATRAVVRALYLVSSGESLDAPERLHEQELHRQEQEAVARNESPDGIRQLRQELAERFHPKEYYWDRARSPALLDDNALAQRLLGVQKDAIPDEIIEEVKRLLHTSAVTETFNVLSDGSLSTASSGRKKFVECRGVLEVFLSWLLAVLKYREVLASIRPLQEELSQATSDAGVLDVVRNELMQKVSTLRSLLKEATKRRKDALAIRDQTQARIVVIGRKSLRAKQIQEIFGEDIKDAWHKDLIQLRRRDEDDTADGTQAANAILVAACEVYLGSIEPSMRDACMGAWMEVLLNRGLRPSLSSGSKLVDWSGSHEPVQVAVNTDDASDGGESNSSGSGTKDSSSDDDDDDDDDDLFDDAGEMETALQISFPGTLACIPVGFGATDLRLYFPVGDILDTSTSINTVLAWLNMRLPVDRALIAQARLMASLVEENRKVREHSITNILLPWAVRIPYMRDPDQIGLSWLRGYSECTQRRIVELESCASKESAKRVFEQAKAGRIDMVAIVARNCHESFAIEVVNQIYEYMGRSIAQESFVSTIPQGKRMEFDLVVVCLDEEELHTADCIRECFTMYDFRIANTIDALTLGFVETLLGEAPAHLASFQAWQAFATVHLSTLGRKTDLHRALMAELCIKRHPSENSQEESSPISPIGSTQVESSQATEILLEDKEVFERVVQSGKDYLQVLQSFASWTFDRMGNLGRMLRRSWPLASFAGRLFFRITSFLQTLNLPMNGRPIYSTFATKVKELGRTVWVDHSATLHWEKLYYAMAQLLYKTLELLAPQLDGRQYLTLQLLCSFELIYAQRVRIDQSETRAFVRSVAITLFDGTNKCLANGEQKNSKGPRNVTRRRVRTARGLSRPGSTGKLSTRNQNTTRPTLNFEELRRVTARLDLNEAARRASGHIRRHSSSLSLQTDPSMAAALAIQPDYGSHARMTTHDWSRVVQSALGEAADHIETLAQLMLPFNEASVVDILQLKLANNPLKVLESQLAKAEMENAWNPFIRFIVIVNSCPSFLVRAATSYLRDFHENLQDMLRNEQSRPSEFLPARNGLAKRTSQGEGDNDKFDASEVNQDSDNKQDQPQAQPRRMLRNLGNTKNRISLRNIRTAKPSATSDGGPMDLKHFKSAGVFRKAICGLSGKNPIVILREGFAGVIETRKMLNQASQESIEVNMLYVEILDDLDTSLENFLSKSLHVEDKGYLWIVLDNPQQLDFNAASGLLAKLHDPQSWVKTVFAKYQKRQGQDSANSGIQGTQGKISSSSSSSGSSGSSSNSCDSDSESQSQTGKTDSVAAALELISIRLILVAPTRSEVPSPLFNAAHVFDFNDPGSRSINLGDRFKSALHSWDVHQSAQSAQSLPPYRQLWRQVILAGIYTHEVISCLRQHQVAGQDREQLLTYLARVERDTELDFLVRRESQESVSSSPGNKAEGEVHARMILDFKATMDDRGSQIDVHRLLLRLGEIFRDYPAGRCLLEAAMTSSELIVPLSEHGQRRCLIRATPWAKAYQLQVLNVHHASKTYTFSSGTSLEDIDRSDWFVVCGADTTQDSRYASAESNKLRRALAETLFPKTSDIHAETSTLLPIQRSKSKTDNRRFPGLDSPSKGVTNLSESPNLATDEGGLRHQDTGNSQHKSDARYIEDKDKDVEDGDDGCLKQLPPKAKSHPSKTQPMTPLSFSETAVKSPGAARLQLWQAFVDSAKFFNCSVQQLDAKVQFGAPGEFTDWADVGLNGVFIEGLRWNHRLKQLEGPYLVGKRSLGPTIFIRFARPSYNNNTNETESDIAAEPFDPFGLETSWEDGVQSDDESILIHVKDEFEQDIFKFWLPCELSVSKWPGVGYLVPKI